MKQEKSLKKQILIILISFSIFVAISVGLIAMVNFYYSKLNIIQHNQKQILFQIESEIEKFLLKIDKISLYIKNNYKENSSLLKNIVDTNTNISSILILDKNGIIEDFYATSNLNIYKGFDYSNQEYFKGIQENSDYWSNVFLSTVDEEASISYSFKLNDKVVVLMIQLREVSDFISRFKNQDTTSMVKIFDNSGTIILNPNNPDLVLQRVNEKTEEIFTKLVDILEPYQFAVYYSNGFQQKQYGTYTYIERTGWKIVVRESYELILKSLNSIIWGMIFSIIVFIIVAVLLSLKISKRIFRSFDDLQQTTTNIANGNYNIDVRKSYYSEFNLLLNSFNKMKIEIDKREDSLEASLNSFKSLFNSTMEVIVIHDKGICLDANNVALKFLKLNDKKELIGKDLLNFVDEKYKELLVRNYKKNTLPYEFDIIENGVRHTCLGQGKFIKLNGKKVKLSTLIDITELKAKDKLLFQQSKMASMGEMIGNIAHQWRQPLSVISTCASGIKFEKEFNEIKDDRLYEALDLIVENTQYLSKTIDDFRNFFKADKVIEDFCINDSIFKVLKLLKSSIQNHNIQVETHLDGELIINGYPNEFLQVLVNLINNAKDALLTQAMDSRFISIRTCVKNKKYIIEVNDNGGGIDESIISKIFDPYFTTKHKSQGTGIGLYMSHQIIVEHMKGTLSVKNIEFKKNKEVYKGCSLIITLPVNENKNLEDYII
ncbi:MAG: ATP-binding protein [Aliarcobacter sp.]|nr:ATP-binding protein [Aliarcobacter sp.]